jgi:hypothetical protein
MIAHFNIYKCSFQDIEAEVFSGILKKSKAEVENRVLVVLREIQNIEKYSSEDCILASKFIDMNIENEIDGESVGLFNSLKAKLSDHLPSENIHRFKVRMVARLRIFRHFSS